MLLHVFRSVVVTELLLPWLHTLPDLFIQSVATDTETSSLIIHSMVAAAVRGNDVFLVVLEKMINTVFSE